jgi:hypothetical protein
MLQLVEQERTSQRESVALGIADNIAERTRGSGLAPVCISSFQDFGSVSAAELVSATAQKHFSGVRHLRLGIRLGAAVELCL